MADNINPCWLAEGMDERFCWGGFLGVFSPKEVGAGEMMGKVMAFWQAGGCAWARVAQLRALMGAMVA